MSASASSGSSDVEQGIDERDTLYNSSVKELSWSNVTVTVKDKATKKDKAIVDDVCGVVKAGEMCALMGPSGSGKTTLLNILANRSTNVKTHESKVLVNSSQLSISDMRQIAGFVEQDDALMGALTIRETIEFTSRLSDSTHVPRRVRRERVDWLLRSFGLTEQANTIIDVPFRQGVSGGEKRRVGVASQLISCPKILFLDEPTSGIDSTASFNIIKHLKQVARESNLIMVISIHQPSDRIFRLFDKLLLLSGGKTHYFGPVSDFDSYYRSVGVEIPDKANPCEYVLETVNVDFAEKGEEASQSVEKLQQAWENSPQCKELSSAVQKSDKESGASASDLGLVDQKPRIWSQTVTLLHRSWIKSHRDVGAYAPRVVLYLAFALMLGTNWLRLSSDQSSIALFISAIFYSITFTPFLSVTYTPAFLEDLRLYKKERHNGLYGPTAFLVANTIIGSIYLLFFALCFSFVTYWSIGFRSTAAAFFTFVAWMLLTTLCGESIVTLTTVIFPSFTTTLAVFSFSCAISTLTNVYLIPRDTMNAFYKYACYHWNYQKYVVEGMMTNEFKNRVFSCGSDCRCMYSSPLASQCQIPGQVVLEQNGLTTLHGPGFNVGIVLAIVVAVRLMTWLWLRFSK